MTLCSARWLYIVPSGREGAEQFRIQQHAEKWLSKVIEVTEVDAMVSLLRAVVVTLVLFAGNAAGGTDAPTVLITGANRGLGLAFTAVVSDCPAESRVPSRTPRRSAAGRTRG